MEEYIDSGRNERSDPQLQLFLNKASIKSDSTDQFSMFDKDAVKEYTDMKTKMLFEQEKLKSLISMREQAIDMRKQNKMELIHKQLKENKISQAAFQNKLQEIELWSAQEKEDLVKTQTELEKGSDRPPLLPARAGLAAPA